MDTSIPAFHGAAGSVTGDPGSSERDRTAGPAQCLSEFRPQPGRPVRDVADGKSRAVILRRLERALHAGTDQNEDRRP